MTEMTETGDVIVHGERFVPYISEDEIQHRVGEIASGLRERYAGTRPIALCILNGAFMFYADLLRRMDIDCETDFMKIASYGGRKESSRDVQLVLEPRSALEGRDVILVEDIVDSGFSMEFLREYLLGRGVRSLTIAALLHKPDRAVIHHTLDYVGFTIPDKFVIGYGLDYDQHARYLPSIFILEEHGNDS